MIFNDKEIKERISALELKMVQLEARVATSSAEPLNSFMEKCVGTDVLISPARYSPRKKQKLKSVDGRYRMVINKTINKPDGGHTTSSPIHVEWHSETIEEALKVFCNAALDAIRREKGAKSGIKFKPNQGNSTEFRGLSDLAIKELNPSRLVLRITRQPKTPGKITGVVFDRVLNKIEKIEVSR